MYNEHIIGLDEHLSWVGRLRSDDKQIVFAVLSEQRKPIGVVSLNALDSIHRKADWAFYRLKIAPIIGHILPPLSGCPRRRYQHGKK